MVFTRPRALFRGCEASNWFQDENEDEPAVEFSSLSGIIVLLYWPKAMIV